MTQTRGTFPDLYSNHRKPSRPAARPKPLPIHKVIAPAKPAKKAR